MGLISWFDRAPLYTVKFNSDGARGYEVNQVTFGSRKEAEDWIRDQATGPKENYKVVRTS